MNSKSGKYFSAQTHESISVFIPSVVSAVAGSEFKTKGELFTTLIRIQQSFMFKTFRAFKLVSRTASGEQEGWAMVVRVKVINLFKIPQKTFITALQLSVFGINSI
jgi:hypothetical protein